MRTISWETMKRWRWTHYDGVLRGNTLTPSGKPYKQVYGNCIAYMKQWYKTREKWCRWSDGWIYFTVNNRKYRTPLS